MTIWARMKKFISRWFASKEETGVLDVLDKVNPTFLQALVLVRKLDEELKPLLVVKRGLGENFYVVVLDFLKQFSGIDATALAAKVANLDIPDLLFTLAIEILRTQSGNATLSLLRLAVELAYSVYKNSKKGD